MAGRHHGFWMGLTVVLSAVFAALFLPVAHERYGLGDALIYTGVGLIVIWCVYFARAAIFARVFRRH